MKIWIYRVSIFEAIAPLIPTLIIVLIYAKNCQNGKKLPKIVENGRNLPKIMKILIYHVSILWGDHFSYPDVGNRNLAHHNRHHGNYAADYFRFRWRPQGYPQLGAGCPCNHAHNRFFHFLTKCNLTCKVTKEINVNKIIS